MKQPNNKNEGPPTEKTPLEGSNTDNASTAVEIHDLELGEYFLHVYILETVNLETDGHLNALINVDAIENNKYTKVMRGLGPTSKTFWGEHIFFQKKFETREELENAKLTLTVYNHNSIRKNDVIGYTSTFLINIYGNKEHCLVEQWAILTNPQKDVRSPMGFIKFSACFDRVNKKHPNLELMSLEKSNSSLELLTIPPEIKLKSKQLIIKVFKGKNIIPMDFDGTADPFVKFNVGATKIQTPPQKSTLNPVFYQNLFVPLLYPTVIDRMNMTFKDYDLVGKNEVIGSTYYLLSEILKGKYSKPHWTFFYGGYDKCVDKDFLKKMNKNSELGSRVTGSLLLAMDIVDSEETKFTIEDMTKEEVAQENEITKVEFQARVDVHYIQNLKCDASELKFSLKWGSDKGVLSAPVTYKRGVLVYDKSFILKETFEISEKIDLYAQLPDIILSIVSGDLHISYLRIKCSDYLITNEKPFHDLTLRMNADLAVCDTAEDKAGILKMKIGVEKTANFTPLIPKWPEMPPKSNFEKIYLVIHLVRAKDLLPADPTSTSDPIVQFYHLGSTTKSSLFPETLNPSWNERIVMQSFLINGEVAPLVINVSDRDENFIGTVSYDFLGSTYLILDRTHIVRSKAQLADIKPKWFDLSLGQNQNLGKILVGVKIVREEFFPLLQQEGLVNDIATFTKPLSFSKTKHHIKINILGLRNLQSNGIFPVRSVNLKINTSSLKPANQIQKGSAFSNLTATSKSGGSNPSIGTVLSLSVELPDELIMIPTLSCQVLENSLSFLKAESLIGTFQIELAAHAYISKVSMIEKLKVVQRYRQDLKQREKDKVQIHESVLNKINGIIRHLEAGINLNLNYIKDQEKDIYTKGEEIKENIGMLTASTLANHFEKLIEKDQNNMTQDVKENKEAQPADAKPEEQTQEKPPEQIVLKDEGFFSVFLPETNANDDEKLKILSNPRINADVQSQRLMNMRFNDIIPQEKIVIKPDSNNPLWMAPNPKYYITLGYKSTKADNRHYRFFMGIEMEDSFYMGEDLYTSIDIYRGKKHVFGKTDIVSRLFATFEENFRKVGTFKGNIDIIQDEVLNQIFDLNLSDKELSTIEIPRSLNEWKFSKLDADMLKGTRVLINLYVISANFYTSEDINSENDSYLKVNFGGKTIVDDKVVNNKNNPKFYKKFTFEGTFPGPSDLSVEFYDEDDLNTDDLIGRTVVDVERRFFDKRWRSFMNKPIETRKIYHPNSEAPIGDVMMWIDVEPIAKGKTNEWNIDPRPVTNLELRIVVWEIYDMPFLDIEEVSDLFVSVSLPNFDMIQKTDTHLRAQNGFGSFNWRTVFKLKIDENSRPELYRANFRVYDRDLLSPDDFTADGTIDFSSLVQTVLENESRSVLTGVSSKGVDGSKEFVIPLNMVKLPKDSSQKKKKPFAVVSVDLLSESAARNSPVGIGRSDPNQDPYLPNPKGRFGFSLNPLFMLEQLMGPAFKAKLCGICAIITIVLIILIFLPIFISTLISVVIAKKAVE